MHVPVCVSQSTKKNRASERERARETEGSLDTPKVDHIKTCTCKQTNTNMELHIVCILDLRDDEEIVVDERLRRPRNMIPLRLLRLTTDYRCYRSALDSKAGTTLA